MKKGKVLHIHSYDEKFVPISIKFIRQNFDNARHSFVVTYVNEANAELEGANVGLYKYFFQAIPVLCIQVHTHSKILIHGLFDIKLVMLLLLMPWNLRKCYWAMWGGDLYGYKPDEIVSIKQRLQGFFRKSAIKNMGHLLTYIKGDYELAREWYGARGEYHECLMYVSNVFKEYELSKKKHGSTNILIGNSADRSNNHEEILDKLLPYKDTNIKIYCPLSYGNKEYAVEISRLGEKLFGEKFVPLTNFMVFEKYMEFLARIDIAIFAHQRQQAMGNTITLLGMGAKVFMRSDVTQWQFLRQLGIIIFDLSDVEISKLNSDHALNNRETVKEYFSEKNLKKQLSMVFEQ